LINFGLQVKYRNIVKKLLIGFLGAVGAVIIFVVTGNEGAGLTPDSVAYISVARNLVTNYEFVNYEGIHLVLQPPLYPIVLALIKILTTFDPIVSASYLNSFLFGLNVYLSGMFLLKHLKSLTLVCLGTLSVLLSFALIKVAFIALSETLFVTLIIIFLYHIETYQRTGKIFSFIMISISTSLACLTRYTGVVLLLTGMICILVRGENKLKDRIGDLFSFTIIAVLPIGGWIVRNYLISNTFAGERASSSYTFLENINYSWNTILPWYLPIEHSGIYLVFIFIIIFVWVLGSSEGSIRNILFQQAGPSILFALLYSCIIIISSTTTAYDKISDRLLAPIYIPIVFTVFIIADKILSWLIQGIKVRLITVPFSIGIVLLIAFPMNKTTQFINEYLYQSGWGYNSQHWKKSEMINYLIEHEPYNSNLSYYSNKPEAVYILTSIVSKRSPAKTFYNSTEPFSGDRKDYIWARNKNVFLIWFNETKYDFLFTLEELQIKNKMEKVVHLKDGDIYTFSKWVLN